MFLSLSRNESRNGSAKYVFFRLQQLQAAMKTTQHSNQNPRENENTEHLFTKNRISKLIEERDTLLQTGVYTINDRVIEEIEKEIQKLIDKD